MILYSTYFHSFETFHERKVLWCVCAAHEKSSPAQAKKNKTFEIQNSEMKYSNKNSRIAHYYVMMRALQHFFSSSSSSFGWFVITTICIHFNLLLQMMPLTHTNHNRIISKTFSVLIHSGWFTCATFKRMQWIKLIFGRRKTQKKNSDESKMELSKR